MTGDAAFAAVAGIFHQTAPYIEGVPTLTGSAHRRYHNALTDVIVVGGMVSLARLGGVQEGVHTRRFLKK
jgi:hypothetical protein